LSGIRPSCTVIDTLRNRRNAPLPGRCRHFVTEEFAVRSISTAILALIFALTANAAEPIRIAGETKYKPHALVRLKAEGVDAKAAILWRIHPSHDVQRATTAKGILEFAARPGVYEVELLAIVNTDSGLVVDESRISVEIEGCGAKSPDATPKPPSKPNAEKALGKLKFGTAGCTATVIGPRRPDGKWDILTAAHCTGGVGNSGTFAASDGRTIGVTVAARDTTSDLCWLVTDAVLDEMPFARLAAKNPAANADVWHKGFGVDRPGNREEGRVTGDETSDGQLPMELSVSSGDSGGGIFRTDSNELIAVVCCTTERGRKVLMFGGSAETASRLRPSFKTETDSWEPLPMPIRTAKRTGAEAWNALDIPIIRNK